MYDMPLISPSMRSSFKACPRKVYYRYVAGIQPKRQKSNALIIGRAFHTALELYRTSEIMADAIGVACAQVNDELTKLNTQPQEIQNQLARMRAYLTGYDRKFGNPKGLGWQAETVLKTDTEINILDAYYLDKAGRCWIVEDKTRAQFTPQAEYILRMDEQLMSYALMMQESGFKLGGFIYRETKKTTIQQTKKETPEDFAARVMARYLDPDGDNYRQYQFAFDTKQLDMFAKQKEATDLAIGEAMVQNDINDWQFNCASCNGKYGVCEFLPLCANDGDHLGQAFEANGKLPLDNFNYQKHIGIS